MLLFYKGKKMTELDQELDRELDKELKKGTATQAVPTIGPKMAD